MSSEFIHIALTSALIVAQFSTAVAQPVPPTGPPRPDLPQVQPPRPDLPQIQPARPTYPAPVQPPIRPQPPTPPYGERPQILPPVGPGDNFAGVARCESRNNRWQRCRVSTSNRVELVARLSGACQRGRTWGFTQDYVWVDRGCRANFGYGYASTSTLYPLPAPQPVRDRSPNAGAVIAGVVVAGGLIALLANRNKASAPTQAVAETPRTYSSGPPATMSADLSSLPSSARSSVQNCMFDAARQVGVTGGTRLRLDRTNSLEQGNGGWRLSAAVTATYPSGDRALQMYCRATPSEVIQLDFS